MALHVRTSQSVLNIWTICVRAMPPYRRAYCANKRGVVIHMHQMHLTRQCRAKPGSEYTHRESSERTKWKFVCQAKLPSNYVFPCYRTFFFLSLSLFSRLVVLSPPSSHYLFLIWSVIEISLDVDDVRYTTTTCESTTTSTIPRSPPSINGVYFIFVEQISNFLSVNRDHPYAVRLCARFGSMCANFQLQFMRNCEWKRNTLYTCSRSSSPTHTHRTHTRAPYWKSIRPCDWTLLPFKWNQFCRTHDSMHGRWWTHRCRVDGRTLVMPHWTKSVENGLWRKCNQAFAWAHRSEEKKMCIKFQ